MKASQTWFIFAAGFGVFACGDELPDVDCSGDVPKFADVAALPKCATCHSSQLTSSARKGAPASVNFDTESAANASAEEAASEVSGGDMPPSGSGISLSEEEKQALYKWALCR